VTSGIALDLAGRMDVLIMFSWSQVAQNGDLIALERNRVRIVFAVQDRHGVAAAFINTG
jgi:hypothetical protein